LGGGVNPLFTDGLGRFREAPRGGGKHDHYHPTVIWGRKGNRYLVNKTLGVDKSFRKSEKAPSSVARKGGENADFGVEPEGAQQQGLSGTDMGNPGSIGQGAKAFASRSRNFRNKNSGRIEERKTRIGHGEGSQRRGETAT